MAKMKKFKVLSFAKFQAVVLAIVGLFAGILYSFGGAIYDLLVSAGVLSSTSTSGLSYGTALAFLALFGMPVIFAAFGFMAGLVEAVLYNIFAKWFGWLKTDFIQ